VGTPLGVRAQDAGRIVGRVLSSQTALPLASASIYLSDISEGAVGALSSVDGRYVMRGVPAGTHSVTVQLLGYATKTVTNVEVGPGQTAVLDLNLDQQAIALAAITVTSEAERSSTTALLTERRLSVVVSDAIGAEQISRSPDGDAGAALKRVPGLSVVDGKYAYVRGLGERYSQTTLNGAPLASPEPDKKVIPLDLIPSDLLESIVTSKSFSPDQPGDYAGGLVQLRTRDFPSDMILSVSASGELNSVSSFKDRLGYSGGGTDFLGFDDGTRGVPSLIPRNVRVNNTNFSDAQLQEMGRAFQGDWGPTQRKLPMNGSLALSFGDDYDIGDNQRAGFIASAHYSSSESARADMIERVLTAAGAAQPEADYTGDQADHSVTIGGLLNFTYQPRPSDQIKLATVYNHVSNDVSRVFTGFNLDSNTDLWNSRLQFLEQTLLNAQLEGEHLLGLLGESTFQWRGAYTRASRYEPSTRESLYRETASQFLWDDFIQSGSVFHQDLVDDGFNGGGSLRIPFSSASIAFGGSFEIKDRNAYTRRFRFRPVPGGIVDGNVRTLSPNELFGGPGTYIDPNGFALQEATFPTDNYDASQDQQAGYAMIELQLTDALRISGGARVEHSIQKVTPNDLFGTGFTSSAAARLETTDVLPAINATLALTDRLNLRASGSRTLARPELRELAAFKFADYAGGYLVVGNPSLGGTAITNADLRLEWFRTPRSVLAVSTFYKDFKDPIETAVLPSTELIKTWVNARGGQNYGIELEARSPLDFLGEGLSDVLVNGNLTLVRSSMNTGGAVDVYLESSGATQITMEERDRALQGQSPYVVNLGLTWAPGGGPSASLLFNRFGERIDAIGAQSLPDVYESARNQLDAVVEWPLLRGWRARVAASRLLGNVVEFTQGDDLLRSYDLGRSVSFGLSWVRGADDACLRAPPMP
jgi:TonB-dependent receptor